MRNLLYILLAIPLLTFSQSEIKIDGFFDDWVGVTNTYIDSENDSPSIELLNFSVTHNDEYVFVRVKLGNEIDLTESYINPAELFIYIDADNNSNTGFSTNNIGSEYGINFFEKFVYDDTNPNSVGNLSFYELDIIPLPTITSDEFEIAINRSLFADTIAISIKEYVGNDQMPDNGEVFNYVFNNSSFPITQPTDFLKNEATHLRLMSYNVLGNGLKNNNRINEHRRIFASTNADIITFQECGSTTYNDVVNFLNSEAENYPYIYPDLNSGNLTVSKYPSVQSWQVTSRIDAELIALPDSIYATDILIINGHPPCCSNNQGRQAHVDAFIQFILDAKTEGGIIDLPTNTPILFSGDMNLVGYSEQYYTIVNGTISDVETYGNGGFPDWDDSPLQDQVAYFNEKNVAYTWRETNPAVGDFPPGRLDFIFFTNSVMSCAKSFVISTEQMSSSLLESNNLLWDDTKIASDHLPVIADFVLELSDEYTENSESSNTSECYNYSINLSQGWNLIGYGCENNLDVEVVFASIIDRLVIAKDGLGNAYLPEWNFNGIGNLERGYGYQIKITEGIENYNICE